MRTILLSTESKQVVKILNGEQTIIVRKTAPKCELPIDVYIYCIKGNRSKRFNLFKNKCDEYHLGWEYTSEGNENVNDIVDGPYNGKVVAKFTLRTVELIYWGQDCIGNPDINDMYVLGTWSLDDCELQRKSCLKRQELEDYIGCELDKYGYAWHISDLEILDKPRDIRSFVKPSCLEEAQNYIMTCPIMNLLQKDMPKEFEEFIIKKAPQSWCYVI